MIKALIIMSLSPFAIIGVLLSGALVYATGATIAQGFKKNRK